MSQQLCITVTTYQNLTLRCIFAGFHPHLHPPICPIFRIGYGVETRHFEWTGLQSAQIDDPLNSENSSVRVGGSFAEACAGIMRIRVLVYGRWVFNKNTPEADGAFQRSRKQY